MRPGIQIQLPGEILPFFDAGTTALAEDVYRQPVSGYINEARLARETDIYRKSAPPSTIAVSQKVMGFPRSY